MFLKEVSLKLHLFDQRDSKMLIFTHYIFLNFVTCSFRNDPNMLIYSKNISYYF